MKIALVIGHASDKQGAWGSQGVSEYKYWKKFIKRLVKSGKLPSKHQYKIFERPTNRRGYGSRMKALHTQIRMRTAHNTPPQLAYNEAFGDVYWAYLNSSEFSVNH